MDLWLHNDDDPTLADINLGVAPTGTTTLFPYTNWTGVNFTLYGNPMTDNGVRSFIRYQDGPSVSFTMDSVINSALFADAVRNTLLTGLSLASTGPVTASDTLLEALGMLQVQIDSGFVLSAAHLTNDTFTGTRVIGKNNSGGVSQWDIVYLNSSSDWVLADANGSGTYPVCGIVTATAAGGASTSVLVNGTVRHDAWAWTPGLPIYLSTTAGALTQTAPSGSGEQVQEVGFALDADRAFFHFNPAYVTLV